MNMCALMCQNFDLINFFFHHHFFFCFCYKSNAFSTIIEFIESEKFSFVLIWIFFQ